VNATFPSNLQARIALASVERPDGLLLPEQLAKLAQTLGMGWFSGEDVVGLWRTGILRADFVSLPAACDLTGLLPLRTSPEVDGSVCYVDARTIQHRPDGFGSSFAQVDSAVWGATLKFHPFRLFVLHHVERTLKIETANCQYLLFEDGVRTIAQRRLDDVRRWTSSVEFGQRFDYWNCVCEAAIIAEPLVHSPAHASALPSPSDAVPKSEHEVRVREYLAQLGERDIHQMREDLAFTAETLDDNRAVHVLLRLMHSRERSRLKGRLGGAMHLLAMAEAIRRIAEEVLDKSLPEEDEIGPGQWFPGARKLLYGSDRVFDARRHHLRDYLTQLGLDFGVKVRCYVEGDTELGALDHAVGDLSHVQLVDLAGRFAERGGKGLAFSESLDADKKAGVFSVILLDGDRRDNIRVVERAAKEDRFAGSFFVATPDFECANFSVRELIDIALSISHESNPATPGAANGRRDELIRRGTGVTNNLELLQLLSEGGISDVSKHAGWGRALMSHAIQHPHFGADDPRSGTKRQIVEAVEVILRIGSIGFQRSLARERVDPSSGRAVPR